jgi:hypothetical protein
MKELNNHLKKPKKYIFINAALHGASLTCSWSSADVSKLCQIASCAKPPAAKPSAASNDRSAALATVANLRVFADAEERRIEEENSYQQV